MSKSKAKSIEVSNVRAKAIIFSGEHGCRYVVTAEEMPWQEFHDKYDIPTGPRAVRATGVNMDGTEEHFFLCAVSDCFDPPVWIVRADTASMAEEMFADEEKCPALIGDANTADYDEDSEHLHYNSDGKLYDTESIVIIEVKMVAIDIA